MHKNIKLGDTIYFWFASNDTSGSGDDGASAESHVREGGATASIAPTLSPTPSLLSNATYPAGLYEIAIVASSANGFAEGKQYGVFSTLAVDSQNPSGFIGSFTIDCVPANVTEIAGSSTAAVHQRNFLDTALSGTVQSGSTSTVIKTNLTGYDDDTIINSIVYFHSDANAHPMRVGAEDYDSASGDITVSTMAVIPTAGDEFSLI